MNTLDLSNIIYHWNIVQGSPEWFEKRKGKMTASESQAIGNNGKGLETYITKIMAEYYSTGEKICFSNAHTERGIELEQQARNIYSMKNGCEVKQVGFIEVNEFLGCSPDGLVKEEGGVEIKCVDDVPYFALLLNGEKKVDSGYIWQVQNNLLITGRKWWDLVFYNPNFKKSMIIFRIYPDEKKQEELKEGIAKGTEMIKQIKLNLQK